MMRWLRRRRLAVAISVPIVVGLLIVGAYRFFPRYRNQPSEARAPQKPAYLAVILRRLRVD